MVPGVGFGRRSFYLIHVLYSEPCNVQAQPRSAIMRKYLIAAILVTVFTAPTFAAERFYLL